MKSNIETGRWSHLLARIAQKRIDLRASDGALVGYRYWHLAHIPVDGVRDFYLISPHRKTIWSGPVLEADNWSNFSAVHGVSGIHARLSRRTDDISIFMSDDISEIYGRVRGYGEFVLGDDGWRASRVVVDKLWCPSCIRLTSGAIVVDGLLKSWGIDLIERLSQRYECNVVKAKEDKIKVIDPYNFDWVID